ncbi:MAG TPA: tetratricopeptide repeat protein [Gemmataceae bacterium]|jgi:tetratricopeptide (TPR) repeat protein|nr:tetratricopeptide repeat protein [Gemmataceae bacterium]
MRNGLQGRTVIGSMSGNGATAMEGFNLGQHTRHVSTHSAEAQRWFDLGFNWCFGFNFGEGRKCFEKALEFDPECVMAHWGVAYGSSPFYNLTWREMGEQEADGRAKVAYEHLQKARSLSHRATALENWLVEALARRFQQPHSVSPTEYDRWDDAYAAELRRVHFSHPLDHDVAALLVEALITRTQRRLWDVKTGQPAKGADILEALDVCERSVALTDQQGQAPHPAILHLHIHALEMSNFPERASRSADALSDMCHDAGHLNHMPGHIYVLCGDYWRARLSSQKAIAANDKYLAYAGSLTFYTVACCHDLHLMMHTCMLLGRYKDSVDAADKMCTLLTREVLSARDRPKFAMSLEGYYSTKMHVMVRFGRWREIIDTPLPDDADLYPVTTAMHHYAKGISQAFLKNFPEADEERRRFHETLGQIPQERRFFNNPAHCILAVGEKMLDGELEYHKGNHDRAYEDLRESVNRDDNLEYIEPWAWMHPPRHALAALLLEQGHCEEAEEIYRDDLGLTGKIQRCAQHPDNVWSLHGLAECLQRRGEHDELGAIRAKLTRALALADVPITSSCMCRHTEPAPSACCR